MITLLLKWDESIQNNYAKYGGPAIIAGYTSYHSWGLIYYTYTIYVLLENISTCQQKAHGDVIPKCFTYHASIF